LIEEEENNKFNDDEGKFLEDENFLDNENNNN